METVVTVQEGADDSVKLSRRQDTFTDVGRWNLTCSLIQRKFREREEGSRSFYQKTMFLPPTPNRNTLPGLKIKNPYTQRSSSYKGRSTQR